MVSCRPRGESALAAKAKAAPIAATKIPSNNTLLTWEPRADQFDCVVSISTIEHVGLGYSGDPLRRSGDAIACQHLWSALKPGGKLFVTLPAGRPHEQRGYRTYDEARIRRLIPGIERLRFFRKPGRFGHWTEEDDAAKIADLVYQDYDALYPTEAVAIVEARKPKVRRSGSGT